MRQSKAAPDILASSGKEYKGLSIVGQDTLRHILQAGGSGILQASKQARRQAGRQGSWQAGKQAGKEAGRQASRQASKQASKQTIFTRREKTH